MLCLYSVVIVDWCSSWMSCCGQLAKTITATAADADAATHAGCCMHSTRVDSLAGILSCCFSGFCGRNLWLLDCVGGIGAKF